MLDDIDRLRNDSRLLVLLAHYAQPDQAEKSEVWVQRLCQLDGVEPRDLVQLHGELIAFSWIEQNTGQVPTCYRITPSGGRALHQAQGSQMDEVESTGMPLPERSTPKFPRKKRGRGASLEDVAPATSE